MEKKSILEKTNSWRPFLDASKEARLGRDYRRETLRKILSIIDPEVSLWPGSLFKAIAGLLIGPGFQLGRTLSFYAPCQLFVQKNRKVFVNAPVKVIGEFNELMNFLFPEKEAATLRLDEKLARRKLSAVEKALEEGQKAQESLTKLVSSNQRVLAQLFSPHSTGPSPTGEKKKIAQAVDTPHQDSSIFSTLSTLDDETKQTILSIFSDVALSYEHEDRPSPQDRKIIMFLEQSVNEYKNASQEIRISFSSPTIVPFKDLLSHLPAPGRLPLNREFLSRLFAQKDEATACELLAHHTQECLKPLVNIKKQSLERVRKITAIDQEKKRLLALIEPFLAKKEVKNRAEILVNELARLNIPPSLYQEQSSPEIEQYILEQEQELKKIAQKLEEQFKELLNEVRTRTEAADLFIFSLCTSLYEIVSAQTPYPDLLQTVDKVRNSLLKELGDLRRSFVEGMLDLVDCKDQMVDCSFNPDVRLIRGEIASRSYRLFDLKQRLINELYSLDFMLSMTNLAQRTNQRLYNERQWLYQFLEKLLNPFPLFIDAFNPDSINTVFRYWWEDFERFLRKKAQRRKDYLTALLPIAETLPRPFLRTLDSIDAIKADKTQSRYTLFTEKLHNKKDDELLTACEQYFCEHPTSFVEMFVPQLCSLSGREQEPFIEELLQLEDRVIEITSFAKDLQAIKTSENERIDSIIPVFSLIPIVPSFDVPVAIRLKNQLFCATQIVSNVEETLLVELGFLSKKARLEQGQSLANLIPKVLLCIPSQLEKKIERLKTLQLSQNPLISSLSYCLLTTTYRLQQACSQIGFNTDRVFQFVQQIALLFMQVHLLCAAQDLDNFSSILLIPTTTHYLTEALRKENTDHASEYNDLISHLESLYFSPLEVVNPDAISIQDFSHKLEEYIHTATRLITLFNLLDRREHQLLSGIQNILHNLPRILLLKKIPELTYIPGCMTYFYTKT